MQGANRNMLAFAAIFFGLSTTATAYVLHDQATAFGAGAGAGWFNALLVAGGSYAVAHAALWFGRERTLAAHWSKARMPGLVIGCLTVVAGAVVAAPSGLSTLADPFSTAITFSPLLAGLATASLSLVGRKAVRA